MAASIYEKREMHNRSIVFTDCIEAGRVLGRMLEPSYAGSPDALILAIPSGGVPVGIEMSDILLNLDLYVYHHGRFPNTIRIDHPEAVQGNRFHIHQEMMFLRIDCFAGKGGSEEVVLLPRDNIDSYNPQ